MVVSFVDRSEIQRMISEVTLITATASSHSDCPGTSEFASQYPEEEGVCRVIDVTALYRVRMRIKCDCVQVDN